MPELGTHCHSQTLPCNLSQYTGCYQRGDHAVEYVLVCMHVLVYLSTIVVNSRRVSRANDSVDSDIRRSVT